MGLGIRVIFYKFRDISYRYPVVRGMVSYSVIWPAGCLIQQKFIAKQELNYLQALRFSIYGGLFVAPTLYGWLTIATRIWPKTTFKSAITKALVEQVTYGPAAMCCFFFGMNLLEFKPISECVAEVKRKFLPTWKMGVCVWPILQTINFVLIPERNRVIYVSICSLVWTSFLAYMKSLDAQRLEEERLASESANTPVPSLPPVNVKNETPNTKNEKTTVKTDNAKSTEPNVKNDNATVQPPNSTAKTKVTNASP